MKKEIVMHLKEKEEDNNQTIYGVFIQGLQVGTLAMDNPAKVLNYLDDRVGSFVMFKEEVKENVE